MILFHVEKPASYIMRINTNIFIHISNMTSFVLNIISTLKSKEMSKNISEINEIFRIQQGM